MEAALLTMFNELKETMLKELKYDDRESTNRESEWIHRNTWKKNQMETPELKSLVNEMENLLDGPNRIFEMTEK